MQMTAGGFVGRKAELEILIAGLQEIEEGGGRLFVISGEAGIGKTRLADEISNAAMERGFKTAWGRAWNVDESPPFWVWREVFENIGLEWPANTEDIDAFEDGRLALYKRVRSALKEIAAHDPVLFVLDDLHEADDSSLGLLRFLVRSLRELRVMIVCTSIDLESRHDGTLASEIETIARDGERINLHGLDRSEVEDLFTSRAGGPPLKTVVATVHEATEGNPFFIEEVARILSADQQLHRPDGSLGFHVPRGVEELFSKRLAPLDPEVRALLGVASVLGRKFHVELLRRVSEVEASTALTYLEEAVDAGIIRKIDTLGRYEFSHVLIREFLYESLDAQASMKLHRRTADEIEALHEADLDPHLPELAHHHFKAGAAGDRRVAIDISLRAAEHALRNHGTEQAVRLYSRALALAELPPVDAEQRGRIELLLQEQIRGGDYEVAAGSQEQRVSVATFQREGDYWTVAHEGVTVRLQDAKGLGYLARLLWVPGREIHVLDLTTPDASLVDRSDTGEVIDSDARSAYRRRLLELQDELADAEAKRDAGRASIARDEMNALATQLTGAVGIGGKARRAGSAAERARVNATKALRAAIERVESELPSLGAHLSRAVRTGTYCSYDPDPGSALEWRL